ncbi:hypothetical protein BU17DRAFT_69944 [Hysterangium stoloniferum]|nr:hypothetical protein BU17DRAFT_69944 [Hysterangium stoloniferum]
MWKWEHRMIRWMEAGRVRDAQFEVKKCSLATAGVEINGPMAQNANCPKLSPRSHPAFPFAVAGILQTACTETNFKVLALTPGEKYTGPSPEEANQCWCSTVTYSLYGGCAWCQHGPSMGVPRPDQISNMTFPLPVHSHVGIPAWAFLNISKGIWSPGSSRMKLSQDFTDLADTIPTLIPLPLATSNASINSIGDTRHSVIPSGAIVGATIGGIAILLILGILLVIFVRRSLRKNEGGGIEPYDVLNQFFGAAPPPYLQAIASQGPGSDDPPPAPSKAGLAIR